MTVVANLWILVDAGFHNDHDVHLGSGIFVSDPGQFILCLQWSMIETNAIRVSANTTAMSDGGPVSLIYGYIFCFFGTLATAASLGELASM